MADGAEAVEQAAAVEHPWWRATAAGLYAATLLAAGKSAEAAEMAEAGYALVGETAAEGYRLRCLAPLAAAGGSPDALRSADDLLSGVTAPPGHAWVLGADAYLCTAQAWSAAGDPARAATACAPLQRATGPGHWAVLRKAADAVAAQNRSVR